MKFGTSLMKVYLSCPYQKTLDALAEENGHQMDDVPGAVVGSAAIAFDDAGAAAVVVDDADIDLVGALTLRVVAAVVAAYTAEMDSNKSIVRIAVTDGTVAACSSYRFVVGQPVDVVVIEIQKPFATRTK